MANQQKDSTYTWGKSVKKGPIVFTPATFDGEKITILVENARVLFTPNVYKGDGSETRLNLCLKESGLGASKIEIHEANLDGDVSSAIKDDYIKCKIDLNTLSLFNEENKKIDNKDIDWINLRVNALIHVRGRWESKTQVGLQLQCTDLQILRDEERNSPFARIHN